MCKEIPTSGNPEKVWKLRATPAISDSTCLSKKTNKNPVLQPAWWPSRSERAGAELRSPVPGGRKAGERGDGLGFARGLSPHRHPNSFQVAVGFLGNQSLHQPSLAPSFPSHSRLQASPHPTWAAPVLFSEPPSHLSKITLQAAFPSA